MRNHDMIIRGLLVSVHCVTSLILLVLSWSPAICNNDRLFSMSPHSVTLDYSKSPCGSFVRLTIGMLSPRLTQGYQILLLYAENLGRQVRNPTRALCSTSSFPRAHYPKSRRRCHSRATQGSAGTESRYEVA